MAVSNSLAKTNQASNTITYEAGGEQVKLSPSMIKNYLVSGNGNVTDQEVTMFLSLCRFQHLNPFLREAYLIKFGNTPATVVVGKEVLLKRAMRSGKFEGLQGGVIVLDAKGNLAEREGTFVLDTEKLVGGWAKVYLKDYATPFYSSVSMKEYSTGKSNWISKPATMIRKVAVAQALKEAFPEEMGGLYDQAEISEVSDKELDTTPVEVPTIASEPTDVKVTEQIIEKPQNSNESVTEGIDDILYPSVFGD